jgi:hypothetical protein
MTKYDIATHGKSPTKQRIPSSIDDPRHAYYPTATDWETFLVCIGVIDLLTIILITFFII